MLQLFGGLDLMGTRGKVKNRPFCCVAEHHIAEGLESSSKRSGTQGGAAVELHVYGNVDGSRWDDQREASVDSFRDYIGYSPALSYPTPGHSPCRLQTSAKAHQEGTRHVVPVYTKGDMHGQIES